MDQKTQTLIKIIIAILCALPLVIHIWNDSRGDRKKGNDIIVLSVLAGLMAYGFKHLHVEWHKTLPVMFGWHFLIFDYWIVKRLVKNKFINPNSDWFSYLGQSSWVDNIPFWRGMHPAGRFVIREAVFFGSLIWLFL